MQAQYDVDSWSAEYRATKGWFFQCDDECQRNWNEVVQAKKVLAERQKTYNKRISGAKSRLGEPTHLDAC